MRAASASDFLGSEGRACRVRTAFEKELERLQDELIDLGVMVERTITDSVEMLKKREIEAGPATDCRRFRDQPEALLNRI